MKLRMAPNSVFAVLLRSPWWISLLIALAVAAATQALLPADLRNIGSTAALPFLVVAGVALWRQLHAPRPAEVARVLAEVSTLGWPAFEDRLRAGFARQGFTVQPATGGGADLLLERQGRRTVVAARRWKAARQGEEALAPLQAARDRLEAQHAVLVALGELTPQARRLVATHGIELLQGDALVRLLRR